MIQHNNIDAYAPAEIAERVENAGVAKAKLATIPTLGGRPSRRVDERDIMFARGRLAPGSPEYQAYYALRPENRSRDDHTRSLPGLLSTEAELAEPLSFAAADA